jgi:hypothetical protein
MTDPTTAGDAYDAVLIGALRDAFDRVDPVPASVIAAGMHLGDLTGDAQIPQLGQFARELLHNEALANDVAKEDQP